VVWLVATHVTTMSSTSVSSVSVVDEQTQSAIGPTEFPTTDSNKIKKTHHHSNVNFFGLSLFHLYFQSRNVFNFVNLRFNSLRFNRITDECSCRSMLNIVRSDYKLRHGKKMTVNLRHDFIHRCMRMIKNFEQN